MFVLCPHCQFLVTVDPASGLPPARCPQCRGLVTPAPTPATRATIDPTATARVDARDAGVAAAGAPTAPAPGAEPSTGTDTQTETETETAQDSHTPAAGATAVAAAIAADGAPAKPQGARAGKSSPRRPARAATAAATDATAQQDDAQSDGEAARPLEAAVASRIASEVAPDVAPAAEATSTDVQLPSDATANDATDDPAQVADDAPASPPAEPDSPAAVAVKRPPAVATRRQPWHAPAAIAALTLLLVLQMLLAERAQLAADAQWRPVMQGMCTMLGCRLPPWHQPDAFTLLDRNVAADPHRPGQLQVRARFRNDARWAQAWPTLVLTLSDADGRVVGARAFAPAEYLAQRTTQNEVASGQVAAVSMAVIEPGPGVVAFTFEFR